MNNSNSFSQMYRVRFARQLTNNEVDIGDVIVCSASKEQAVIATVQFLDLPVSDTEFEVSRIKPSIFQVSRRKIDHRISTFDASTVNEDVRCRATFPGITESLKEKNWFLVSASAKLKGEDDNDATRMLARAVIREMDGLEQKSSCLGLDIVCNLLPIEPRIADVESNSVFKELRFFQGGDVRT